jgi:hypothetical protein
VSNEKTTKPKQPLNENELHKENEWFNYLKSGKKKKPNLKTNKRKPTHAIFLSSKQKKAFKSGEKDPVFIGALTSKQRKALIGE